jgi:hypothetical protein
MNKTNIRFRFLVREKFFLKKELLVEEMEVVVGKIEKVLALFKIIYIEQVNLNQA